MQSRHRTVIWILVLALVLPGLVEAARKGGKLVGKVLDPDGEPIEGVVVIATCATVSRYEDSDTTDGKGIFKLDFPYLDVVYTLRFAKDGYYPLESQQDWNLEGTARQEFTLFPGEAAVAEAPLVSTSNMAIHNFNQGVEAYNAQDYGTAEIKFRAAVEHDAELHQAWSALSTALLRQERYQEAVDAAERAIELGASDESVWRTRWEGYRNLGDEDKTLAALEDLEDAGVRAAEARRVHNEAVALTKDGRHQEAFDTFQKALEIDPNLHEALVGVATTGLELGRYAEAAGAAKTLLRADPNNEQAIRIRYNAALSLGDQDMIVDALVGLAAVEPEVARDSLLKLAFDAYDADDMGQAETRFLKVLEVDPNHALSHYLLGLIYVNQGANAQSIQHLDRFLQLAPDHEEATTARELLAFLRQPS